MKADVKLERREIQLGKPITYMSKSEGGLFPSPRHAQEKEVSTGKAGRGCEGHVVRQMGNDWTTSLT